MKLRKLARDWLSTLSLHLNSRLPHAALGRDQQYVDELADADGVRTRREHVGQNGSVVQIKDDCGRDAEAQGYRISPGFALMTASHAPSPRSCVQAIYSERTTPHHTTKNDRADLCLCLTVQVATRV